VLRELFDSGRATKEEGSSFFGATKGGGGDCGLAHIEAEAEQAFTEDGSIRTGRGGAIHGESRVANVIWCANISEMIRA
jgi:hypothetical protein